MRKTDGNEKELRAVICNGCGRQLKVEKGVLREGCFCAEQTFGYFSSMDGKRVGFDLCEECFQKLLDRFVIPAEIEEETELF